jgi:large subunit ribosomal protein L32e
MAKTEAVKEFTKIKGVGKAKAEALYKKGYDSLEKLKKADVKDLTKVDGITESIAKNIKNRFKEKEQLKKPIPSKKEKIEEPKPKKAKDAKPKPKKEIEKKTKEEKVEKPKEEEGKEETKIEGEEEKYKVKKKPELSVKTKKILRLRKEIKNRTPNFLREEWFRYKRIPKNWRKPDGITSKMRINLKYRPSKVRVGFRGPKDVRGLHSSGFEEVIVYNVNDLEGIDPKKQAARIGSSVGTKKRIDIEKKADELDVRILNL